MRTFARASYVRYRPDGFIKSRGSCFEGDLVLQSRIGLLVKEITDDDINGLTHYIDVSGGGPSTHVVALRPAMTLVLDKTSIVADGADKATLTGIPAGAILRLPRAPAQSINDGVAEITSDFDGDLDIVVEAFPFATETIRINAT